MKPTSFGYFRASYAKLKRANAHRLELDAEISKFLGRKPYKLIFDDQTSEGVQEFRIETSESVPDEVSCIAGDFFHNLRSSLDCLAVDLVLANNRGTSGIYFPSKAESPQEFERILAEKGGVNKAGKYVIDKIRALEIYLGGDGALIHYLHKTDIIDKHFNIIGMCSKFEPYIINFTADEKDVGKPARTPRIEWPLDNNRGRMDPRLAHPNMKIQPNCDAEFQIAFHQPSVFRNNPLCCVCQETFRSVKTVVDLFALDPEFKNI